MPLPMFGSDPAYAALQALPIRRHSRGWAGAGIPPSGPDVYDAGSPSTTGTDTYDFGSPSTTGTDIYDGGTP
jgi:hypothetical protein